MMIKDLLAIEIPDEIQNVIDLQMIDENTVESEISEYIVTEKLAEHFSKLINDYCSFQKETGVWISGFYGSGKSYFAKVFGHLLENRTIKGTPFSERFIVRALGLPGIHLLQNNVNSLSKYKTHVVYLDIGKKGTNITGGLSYTLFKSFLKSLDFSSDKFGYMEFYLFLNDEYDAFKDKVKELRGEEWNKIKTNRMAVSKLVSDVLKTGFSDEYDDKSIDNLEQTIKSFSPEILAEELKKYIAKTKIERIVFIMDEVSEAISLKKIDLLDLQAISESLSGVGAGRVWTIACAQEKLDDVLKNASLDSNELSKVRDRFKITIHLSSEEVNEIIEKRLLKKNPEGVNYLKDFYAKNEGTIADITTLHNSTLNTKTKDVQEFIECYPFHRYQFKLMGNFLFQTNRLGKMSKSGGTERGMIIAFHGIMKDINNKDADVFVSSWQLNDEGHKNPDGDLIRKYKTARDSYTNTGLDFDGSSILKVVNFLYESKEVDPTLDNITKNLISDISSYYKVKPELEKAVEELEKKNLIIKKGDKYSISSDVEVKLLEEKATKHIQTHLRKRYINEKLKDLSFLSKLKVVTYKNNKFPVNIEDEDGGDVLSSKNSYIKLGLANILIIEDKASFIDEQKSKLSGKRDTILIIPAVDNLTLISKMVTDILQYKEIEGYYASDSDERIKSVLTDFRKNRQEQEKAVISLIEKAYSNGILLQGFTEKSFTSDKCANLIASSLQDTIANTFTELLPSTLTEDLSNKILKQYEDKKLKSMFKDPEFTFFDGSGRFIGSGLKVIEEITSFCSTYKLGSEIETNFAEPPYGWKYETLNVTLAVLMRAGNLKVKAEGLEIFDYKKDNEHLVKIFTNSTKFKKALFQVINENLETRQKQEIVDNLNKIKARDIVNTDFNTHTNDIALVDILKNVMLTQYNKYISNIEKQIVEFASVKVEVDSKIKVLQAFNLSVDDSNFKNVATTYLSSSDTYNDAVELVRDLDEFCKNKLDTLKNMNDFVSNVQKQFLKIGISNLRVDDQVDKWNTTIESDPVNNYTDLFNIHQKIRDEYYGTFNVHHEKAKVQYKDLKIMAEDLIKDAEKKSKTLNVGAITRARSLIQECDKNICEKLFIDQKIECKKCSRSLNEVMMANDLADKKKDEISSLKLSLVEETTGSTSKTKARISVKIPSKELTVKMYKEFLNSELKKADGMDEDSTIIVISL